MITFEQTVYIPGILPSTMILAARANRLLISFSMPVSGAGQLCLGADTGPPELGVSFGQPLSTFGLTRSRYFAALDLPVFISNPGGFLWSVTEWWVDKADTCDCVSDPFIPTQYNAGVGIWDLSPSPVNRFYLHANPNRVAFGLSQSTGLGMNVCRINGQPAPTFAQQNPNITEYILAPYDEFSDLVSGEITIPGTFGVGTPFAWEVVKV